MHPYAKIYIWFRLKNVETCIERAWSKGLYVAGFSGCGLQLSENQKMVHFSPRYFPERRWKEIVFFKGMERDSLTSSSPKKKNPQHRALIASNFRCIARRRSCGPAHVSPTDFPSLTKKKKPSKKKNLSVRLIVKKIKKPLSSIILKTKTSPIDSSLVLLLVFSVFLSLLLLLL